MFVGRGKKPLDHLIFLNTEKMAPCIRDIGLINRSGIVKCCSSSIEPVVSSCWSFPGESSFSLSPSSFEAFMSHGISVMSVCLCIAEEKKKKRRRRMGETHIPLRLLSAA